MGDSDYDIVFRGKLVAGVAAADVCRNLAKLFKTEPDQIRNLLDGKRRVLKSGLDRSTADKYREILRRAGAVVAVVGARGEPSSQGARPSEQAARRATFVVDDPSASQSPAETVVTASSGKSVSPPDARGDLASKAENLSSDALLAPPGALLVEAQAVPAFDIDVGNLSMADVGVTMDESVRPPPPVVDIGDLSISGDYSALDERPLPPPPLIDTSALSAEASDAALDAAESPPPAQIDTSRLSVDDDYDALDDQAKPPTPHIDTSQLRLDE